MIWLALIPIGGLTVLMLPFLVVGWANNRREDAMQAARRYCAQPESLLPVTQDDDDDAPSRAGEPSFESMVKHLTLLLMLSLSQETTPSSGLERAIALLPRYRRSVIFYDLIFRFRWVYAAFTLALAAFFVWGVIATVSGETEAPVGRLLSFIALLLVSFTTFFRAPRMAADVHQTLIDWSLKADLQETRRHLRDVITEHPQLSADITRWIHPGDSMS